MQQQTQKNGDTLRSQERVIGTILVRPASFWDLNDIIEPMMFDRGKMRTVASTIWDLVYNGKPFDFDIVHQLTTFDVSDLRNSMTLAVTDHAEIIREAFITKHILRSIDNVRNNIDGGIPAQEAVQTFYSEYELLNHRTDREVKPTESFNRAKDFVFAKDRSKYSGMPTGFRELDRRLGGYMPGKLYIIGGNPGQGKTTAMLAGALATAVSGKHAIVFSFEMMVEDLIIVLACMLANADQERFDKNELSDIERQEIADAIDQIYEMNLVIYDLDAIDATIEAVASKVFAHAARGECDAVFIDYLQLMTTRVKKASIEQEVAYISRYMKVLSVKASTPFVVLSQLNRENMKRASKRPSMGDLRYSGAIQADADCIILTYRPDVYNIKKDENGNSLENITELIIAKLRKIGAKVPHTCFMKYKNSNLHGVRDLIDDNEFIVEEEEEAELTDEEMPF